MDRYFYKSDVVISKLNSSTYEWNFNVSFQISFADRPQDFLVYLFLLNLDQCGKNIYQRFVFLKHSYKPDNMGDLDNSERPVDISNFILVLFLATICICFFYFLLLAFQAARRTSLIAEMKIQTPIIKVSKKMNYRLFCKIIFYMTFKLFYTVFFTLSLVLSVCLSLNVFTIHTSDSPTPMTTKSPISIPNPTISNSDNSCINIPKSISRHFLFKVRQQLRSQELVRATSPQSIQTIMKQIIENSSAHHIQSAIVKLLNVYDHSLQREIQYILNKNIHMLKVLNDSKWINLLQFWNTSATDGISIYFENFHSDISKDYVRISNLLEIHEFSAILQICQSLENR